MAAFPRPTALAVSFVLFAAGCSGGGAPASRAAASPSPTPTPTPTPSVEPAVRVVATPGEPVYRVSLRANADGTRWRGTQEISFTNMGETTLRKIWLRSWANGVQGCEPLAIAVSGMSGGTLDAVRLDCTALPVRLSEALAPGERAAVGFDLAISVPERNDRFGHHGGLSLLGNALPTLAVHDGEGWHLDPYVDLGESFFSVVGRYRVTLDVPAELRTPSTGSLVSSSHEGGRVFRTFAARDVRDFAWGAGAMRAVRDDAGGVAVTVWYRPSFMTEARARLTLRDAVQAMSAYADAFGPYPYPGVDVITAEFTAFQGMEYPRVIFTNPERQAIAHELAHQWWYGIVGNDQYAEPWLDESFASWASMLPWLPWESCPSYGWPAERTRLTNDMGYWAAHPSEYRAVYEGGGCMLADLADRFGLQRFTHLLAGHAEANWFGVTTTVAFQRRVERAAGRFLDGFDPPIYWETWRVG